MLSLSFTGQGASILSLPLLCRKKGSCLLALAFSLFPQCSPSSPCVFFIFPLGFLALLPSSLEILSRVSISPCEASCILDEQLLPAHASSSRLIPAISIPSSGGSFHAFLFPVCPPSALRSQPGSPEKTHEEKERFGCGWRCWMRSRCHGDGVALAVAAVLALRAVP